jgi:tetratricopeptide (TPR) repeat protein
MICKTFRALALVIAMGALAGAGCRSQPGPGMQAGIRATEEGRWDEAAARWEKALAAAPGSAALHNNLAVAYERLGRRDDARREYDAAREIDPDDPYIKENLAAFERALDLPLASAEPVIPAVPASGSSRARPTVFSVPTAPAVDLGGFHDIIVTNFLEDMPPPGFPLNDWLVDSLTMGLPRVFPGSVERQTVDWAHGVRLENPESWRSAGKGRDAALFLTGTVKFEQSVEKALKKGEFLKDSPFNAKERGLIGRTRFTADFEFVLIPAATGVPAFRTTVQESRTYDVAGHAADTAFADLVDRAQLRLFRFLAKSETPQTRYLLTAAP